MDMVESRSQPNNGFVEGLFRPKSQALIGKQFLEIPLGEREEEIERILRIE